jgi:hypothetical protein
MRHEPPACVENRARHGRDTQVYANLSGESPEATRESRMLTCTRPRVAPFGLPVADVDEGSPKTLTPFRGMSSGQVYLKPPHGFRFRAAPLAAWFPRTSADDRLQCAREARIFKIKDFLSTDGPAVHPYRGRGTRKGEQRKNEIRRRRVRMPGGWRR